MTTLALSVNGRAIERAVEPRTHLADLLREALHLTGTHLGCEHGICGACTILLDGTPARSCITYAVACSGAEITTIEGLHEDEVATELRAAFSREHALQCGYCTPGMLITARDLAIRLPDPDEAAIRLGLGGNLCRCTGYVGIVRAIAGVVAARRARGIAALPGAGRTRLGPAGSGHAAPSGFQKTARSATPVVPADITQVAEADDLEFVPAATFEQRLSLPFRPEQVFDMFGRIKELAACLPGAAVTGRPSPDRVEGEMRVRLGPISAVFRGVAAISRDPATLSGRIVGRGLAAGGRSSTRGEIRYRISPSEAGSDITLTIGYKLSGLLAQFGRPGLVNDLAGRVTAEFARRLEARMTGGSPAEDTAGPTRARKGAGWMVLLSLWLRLKARVRGRS